ncbi:MAG: hypothetical protein R2845_01550 [Thermomicrobiales bacterium]
MVPTVSAIRSADVAPLPTFAQAPSPTGGYHGNSASSGHRSAHSGRSPDAGSRRDTTGGNSARSMPAMPSAESLQSPVASESSPVPVAIASATRSTPSQTPVK